MLLKTTFLTTRPAFLILSPICVLLGFSTASGGESDTNLFILGVILLGALSAHISVNTLNEYYDFKSGLDLKTEKTPFSGGSGALPEQPRYAKYVLALGLGTLLLTVICGLYLAVERGSQILPIGIVGALLIVSYTQWLNRVPFLCLLAPGLGFGILMVIGTHMMLAEGSSDLPWLVSLVCFFLMNNLLLLNQYPDIKADASVGRKTFPIAYGLKASNAAYALFMILAYGLIGFGVISKLLPQLSLIGLIPVLCSSYALYGACKYKSQLGEQSQYLAANVVAAILAPLLLAISLLLSAS
jgi:1,4-dihydroxy-2-naphthoate octaprenyltransferase